MGSMEEQQRIVDELNGEGLASDDPRDFLDAVWGDRHQPMARRVKVALELMPYLHPRLAVTAVSNVSGADFASLLEKAIARSCAPLQIDHQPNEGAVIEPAAAAPPGIRGRSGSR